MTCITFSLNPLPGRSVSPKSLPPVNDFEMLIVIFVFAATTAEKIGVVFLNPDSRKLFHFLSVRSKVFSNLISVPFL